MFDKLRYSFEESKSLVDSLPLAGPLVRLRRRRGWIIFEVILALVSIGMSVVAISRGRWAGWIYLIVWTAIGVFAVRRWPDKHG